MAEDLEKGPQIQEQIDPPEEQTIDPSDRGHIRLKRVAFASTLGLLHGVDLYNIGGALPPSYDDWKLYCAEISIVLFTWVFLERVQQNPG